METKSSIRRRTDGGRGAIRTRRTYALTTNRDPLDPAAIIKESHLNKARRSENKLVTPLIVPLPHLERMLDTHEPDEREPFYRVICSIDEYRPYPKFKTKVTQEIAVSGEYDEARDQVSLVQEHYTNIFQYIGETNMGY